MRLKVDRKAADDSGIVYLLEIHLEDKVLVKIGVTTRKIEERVVEILTSIFKHYRVFPYCYPKRFKTTTSIFAKEAALHRYFKGQRYVTQHRFDGNCEFFDVPLEEAVAAYERVLAGEVLDPTAGTEGAGSEAGCR